MTQPAESSRIQTIAGFVVVRCWHEAEGFVYETRGINLLTVTVPTAAGSRKRANSDAVRYERGLVDRRVRAIGLSRLALERTEYADVAQRVVVGCSVRIRGCAVGMCCGRIGTAVDIRRLPHCIRESRLATHDQWRASCRER